MKEILCGIMWNVCEKYYLEGCIFPKSNHQTVWLWCHTSQRSWYEITDNRPQMKAPARRTTSYILRKTQVQQESTHCRPLLDKPGKYRSWTSAIIYSASSLTLKFPLHLSWRGLKNELGSGMTIRTWTFFMKNLKESAKIFVNPLH